MHFLRKPTGRVRKMEVVETWIGQVRRVAYDIEDIVDQFIYTVGQVNKKTAWWDLVKKIVKKPRSLFSLDEIATEIKRIIQELKQISESRDRWAKPLDGGADIPEPSYEIEHQLYVPGHDYSINDDDLVGTDKNKKTLVDLLYSKDASLRIIAVWGMGGIGKSTLVNNVYKNEASKFDYRAWVSISQSYKLEDIWKKMLKDLLRQDEKRFDPERIEGAELREKLKGILYNKRYLIVLDDVWTPGVLLKLKEVLVENGLGSRVIITTRIDDVASIAEDGCKIKVEPLSHKNAWHLFCRKALPNIDGHICPPDLEQCGLDIVQKCGGLPLALVAIGSILSLKPKNFKVWSLFRDQLIWELQHNVDLNHVEKILNLSYKYHVEDTAEGYLEELVQRGMLLVVKRNGFGRIKCLQMHDLVRELAIIQSKRESFSTIYDDNHGEIPAGLESRRLSFLRCSKGILSIIDPSRLRNLITFDTSMVSSPFYDSIYSKSKYLTVLDLSGSPIETIPSSIEDLFNLRLLCLDDTEVRELPKSIKKLQNLQTLSLENAQLMNFPRGLSKLRKLQYLFASHGKKLTRTSFIRWGSFDPFMGMWNLCELQVLGSINASKAFVAQLGNLSQLRALDIASVRSSQCAQLCNSLSKMHQLSKLFIRAWSEDEVLQLDSLTLQCSLQKIQLIGQLSERTLESPFFINHGNSLLSICLSHCQLTVNQLSRLSELSRLTMLVLEKAYTGDQLHFHADGFRNLKEISLIELPRVSKICIEDGALVNLENLDICGLHELQDVPIGINFLKTLKAAYFIDMCYDFGINLGKANLRRHIPDVRLTTRKPPR